ncbi:MAG TPA: M28 family peptidase [Thermodesulfovibrionales bacterium]|jgi:Zn-dependent M28 family amino/carboxypeptidase|nr:M28 family peptidase [Thermodesulfovibrionales bacterium]
MEAVRYLSEEIGQRSYLDLNRLNAAADYIEDGFSSRGCPTGRQPFTYDGNAYYNITAEVPGERDDGGGILVVGAHYDTVIGTPGADDNASGVSSLLELARQIALRPLGKTVRLVAFTLEEPPFFMTSRMGSYVYAEGLRKEGVKVYGMIALEMLGYFSDDEGSQFYPASLFKWFYPDRGNFIAFVGNISSRAFTKRIRDSFRAVSSLPVESLNAVSCIPGVDFSDHRSFWKFGYPACMVTDTAFYRNPNYHGPGDTPDTLDYRRMADLVEGLYKAFSRLR